MTKVQLEEIKKKVIPILKAAGVTRSSLFGSYVRGDATEKSDIDMLIDIPRGKTLFDLVRLEFELEEKLHKKVDVLTYKSLSPRIKDYVKKEEMQIL